MKFCRYYIGACLIVVARVAIQAAKGLDWVGRAVMPKQGAKVRQSVSVSRGTVLVPHTVETRSGQRITLYSLERR